MKMAVSLCGAILLAMPGLSGATDYPLAFKTLDAHQAFSTSFGILNYAMIQPAKPAGIVKAPPAMSQRPLYGTITAGSDQLLFRLDESKGTGRGYDRLIVDVNRNGNLTDDPVVSPASPTSGSVATPNSAIFGPIQAPDSLKIGTERPIFYAQVYVFVPAGTIGNLGVGSTVGEIIVKPGWYLEATVNAGGKQHKVDLVDADCNFKLGEVERPVNNQSALNAVGAGWLFEGGDRFVVDWDIARGVQSTVYDDQSCSFGPVLYLDGTPYKAALAADGKSLSLDAWTEPLAELAVPHSEQISSLHLAWEKSPGNWVLIRPGVENGVAKVPPGNYRLYSLVLKAKTASGDSLVMSGIKRLPGASIKAVAGQAALLKCGAPLDVNLTCPSLAGLGSVSSGATVLGALSQGLLGQAGAMRSIQATLLGAGGETYSVPYLMGGNGALRQPPEPTFTVYLEGKKVDSGSLEYG